MAKFSEILRSKTDDIKELSYVIISELVQYVNANQGGLFLINENDGNDKYIEQMAAYAYNRKKFVDKRLRMGEGLVGTCIEEKLTINLKDVPEDYLEITSGLGKVTPRNLILVPLIYDENIFGIIELATFKEFRPYEIKFIEDVGKRFASTLASVNVAIQTSKLLKESQEQSNIHKQREEEFRQNLQELQATQEVMKRQSEEFTSFANTVNHTLMRAEYDMEGKLIYANRKFLYKLGYSKNSEVEVYDKSIFNLIHVDEVKNFKKHWDKIIKGKPVEGILRMNDKNQETKFIHVSFSAVYDMYNEVAKIIMIGYDVSHEKKIERELKEQEEKIQELNKNQR
ncbi:GAF domain-containing protein [Bacteroidota bacterium]